ncbi:MAG: cell envelope integrity protein TolA [Desulfarculales bacterium]|jgi:TolA protein|nr:cell envelope integrity protein TolA [Desulfarculales bacterium]
MRDKIRRAGTVSEQEGLGIVISILLHALLVASVLLWQQFSSSRFHNLTPDYQNVSLLGSAPQTQTPAPMPPKPVPPQPVPPQPVPPQPVPPKPVPPQPVPPKPAQPPAQAIKPQTAKPEIKPEVDASRQLDERLQRMRAEQERQRQAEAQRQAEQERQRQAETQRQAEQERQRQAETQRRQAEQERQRQAETERRRREDQALQNAISQLQTRQAGTDASAAQAGGAANDNMDPLLQAYHDQLWSRIQPNWTLSRARMQDYQDLTAIVTLRIRPDGTLERLWLEESSGNQIYDNAALHAAERSAPFGAPPIANQGVYYEISLRFLGKDR